MACTEQNRWAKADGGNWKRIDGGDWLMSTESEMPCSSCEGVKNYLDANELQRFQCNVLLPGDNPAWWL
jgi:hypothetical protein